MPIIIPKNVAKSGKSVYVHSPRGLRGAGKIIRVCTPVKVTNREYFCEDGEVRNIRESR